MYGAPTQHRPEAAEVVTETSFPTIHKPEELPGTLRDYRRLHTPPSADSTNGDLVGSSVRREDRTLPVRCSCWTCDKREVCQRPCLAHAKFGDRRYLEVVLDFRVDNQGAR